MDEMLIKDGYPYGEYTPEIVESETTPVPYYFMPIRDGEYPYYYTVPEIIEDTSNPMPYYFMLVRDGEYPYYYGVPDIIESITDPQPFYFFAQNDDTNDGYPYMPIPSLITDMTRPKPYYLGGDEEVTLIYNKIIIYDYSQYIKSDFDYTSKVVVEEW